ncbi:MAG TPA: hypothetical protein VI011_15460 [Asanoa sp.]
MASEHAAASGARALPCHACPPESPLAHVAGGPSVGPLELCDPPPARAVAITRARLGGHRVALMKGER